MCVACSHFALNLLLTGGKCTPCPAHLPNTYSRGSTSLASCFTIAAPLYAVSSTQNRVLGYNGDDRAYNLLYEDKYLKSPRDLTFMDETTVLVSNGYDTNVLLLDPGGSNVIDESDLCTCDYDGWVNGINTKHPSCIDDGYDHGPRCYTSSQCDAPTLRLDANLTNRYFRDCDVASDFRGFLGVFANVPGPMGLLYLPELDRVAIASGNGRIYFFKMSTYDKTPYTILDAEEYASMPSGTGQPAYLSRGETDDEILVTSRAGDKIVRLCVPGTECPASRQATMLFQADDAKQIAVIREMGIYLFVDQGQYTKVVYSCPLEHTGYIVPTQCTKFAALSWDPVGIAVDEYLKLIYVGDATYSKIYAFKFNGDFIDTVEESKGDLTSPTAIAIKPGISVPLSLVHPPTTSTAGVRFSVPMTLKNNHDNNITDTYSVSKELSRYHIEGAGLITGSDYAVTLTGSIIHDNTTPAHRSLTGSLVLTYAGTWTVSITEGVKNEQHLHGSPFIVVVEPASTTPDAVETKFEYFITAGSKFTATLIPFDLFGNPTNHSDDSFSASFSSSQDGAGGPSFYLQPDLSFVLSKTMTIAGAYTLDVTHDLTSQPVANSPFHFQVNPGAPDAATSTHNVKQTAVSTRNFHTVPLDVRVYPFDEFGNALTTSASGYSVTFNGGEGLELNLGNSLTHTYTIPAGFSGDLDIAITLDGEHVKDSPITVSITPEPQSEGGFPVVVASTVGGVLLLALVVAGIFFWRGQIKIKRMSSDARSMLSQNQELEDSLMKQRHSDAELEAMRKAMEEQSQERMDDLKNVLVPSGDVEILELLGQGSNGKVHLAMYKGQKVAVKQLIAIDEENCMRFRFECFLTKELTHPNCVSLVGVCWDEMMLGCLLEYIDGGSMGDRIKQDWAKQFREKITWKNELLKWATECALGVQYLHHKKYYDEFEKEWKDCVVHR